MPTTLKRAALVLMLLSIPLASAGAAPPEQRSPRNTPEVPRELRRALREAGVKAGQLGLLARRVDDGRVLVAIEPERPLIPASTMKLVTTACALERLGPAHTFDTRWLARSRPGAEGTLAGNLWIVGSGNPLLRAEDMWVALRELRAVGVRKITGNVVVDDSLFEPAGYPESWPDRRVPDPYDAPQGAMALAWNSVEVIVRPGARIGTAASVETFPLMGVARLVNRVRTDRRTSVRVDLLPDTEASPGGILLRGTIAAGGGPYRSWVHLGDPTRVAMNALGELLAEVGIEVEGKLVRGNAPEELVELVVHRSPPLTQIASAVNKYSSNFGAEMLARSLAVAAGKTPGSTAAGLDELRTCLSEWDVPLAGVRLSDGSGYSRSSRLTARALVELVLAGARRPEWGREWIVSWPRAGGDGSLEQRLEEHRGRLRAKTGTLRGVSSLAGLVRTADGRPVAFAMLVNARPDGAPVGPWLVDRLTDALISSLDRLSPKDD
jgi:D-alanyl-D-alanine carboxypeptidase/D-alanyl-D-alanine-endopeptidase (penicillin-binding protein 4)